MRFLLSTFAIFFICCLALVPIEQVNAAEPSLDPMRGEVKEFVKDLCESAPIVSSRETMGFSAEGARTLRTFLSAFGIKIGGTVETEKSFGVLQRDLADLINKTNDCRRLVFERLITYLEDSRKGRFNETGAEKSRWARIFSPKEISLVPSCAEKSVDCEFPNARVSGLLGYHSSTIFNSEGTTYEVRYPMHLGQIVTSVGGTVSLGFEYLPLEQLEERGIADFQVCHCEK